VGETYAAGIASTSAGVRVKRREAGWGDTTGAVSWSSGRGREADDRVQRRKGMQRMPIQLSPPAPVSMLVRVAAGRRLGYSGNADTAAAGIARAAGEGERPMAQVQRREGMEDGGHAGTASPTAQVTHPARRHWWWE
jgi:hypothetical protein